MLFVVFMVVFLGVVVYNVSKFVLEVYIDIFRYRICCFFYVFIFFLILWNNEVVYIKVVYIYFILLKNFIL